MPRFIIIKKWIEVHNQSLGSYSISKQIRFKTSKLRSDLCDYSDAYIIAKGAITATDPNNDEFNKKLAFENNAPFISCISKIYNALTGNAEDLDIVIPKYNLIEYGKDYLKTIEVCGIITEMNQILV